MGGKLAARVGQMNGSNRPAVEHLAAGHGLLVDLSDLTAEPIELGSTPSAAVAPVHKPTALAKSAATGQPSRVDSLRRCSRCVLPETMPFIDFDSDGVCNYCRTHRPAHLLGREALEQAVASHRSSDGSPDCLVAFSGGRDSSFGLHYLKRELGLNPIAFTYDWGMVTDLARRNQARLCGRLGVEHIIRSANIRRKREHIRLNIQAWLKRPRLGMIPLFMAGDKQFLFHGRRLRRQTGLPLVIFCGGNPLEETRFKQGFAGVPAQSDRGTLTRARLPAVLRLAGYYSGQYLANPKYLNASMADVAWAFWETFAVPDDFLYLFDYLPWREEDVVSPLLEEYGWERAADTQTTWRIGDGTAAFYNYIYLTVAGFTEHDTFRSNQIREGQMSRAEALRHVAQDNQIRMDSLTEYADLVGFDLDEALRVIDSMPKLY
jgi:hypothetical protein